MSLGCGFKFNLPKDISVRIAWGFPLMNNNHEDKQTWGRFHFDVNVTPDFDALLKLRNPKNKVKKENIDRVQIDSPIENVLASTVDGEIAGKIVLPKYTLNEYFATDNTTMVSMITKPKSIIEFNNID